MDGIKLEAETVSGQFEGGDPHLGEEVVQLLGYLWGGEEMEGDLGQPWAGQEVHIPSCW